MLNIKNISKKYGDNIVFENLSLKVNKGEIISITGISGSGKTTFIKCINRLEKINSGQILLNNKDIYDMDLKELRQKIGIVFQNYNLFEHLTIIDNLTIGLIKIKQYSKDIAKKEAIQYLKYFKLDNKINNYPYQLSGGEQQRIAIIRTLLMKPDILLLDEPTSALDKISKKIIIETIKELKKQKISVIIVSHDEKFVKQVSEKVYKFSNKHLERNI